MGRLLCLGSVWMVWCRFLKLGVLSEGLVIFGEFMVILILILGLIVFCICLRKRLLLVLGSKWMLMSVLVDVGMMLIELLLLLIWVICMVLRKVVCMFGSSML